GDLADDGAVGVGRLRMARAGGVEVHEVEHLGVLDTPQLRHLDGIVEVDGLDLVVALTEAHAVAAAQVDGGNDVQHGNIWLNPRLNERGEGQVHEATKEPAPVGRGAGAQNWNVPLVPKTGARSENVTPKRSASATSAPSSSAIRTSTGSPRRSSTTRSRTVS